MEIGHPTDVRHVAHIGCDGTGTSVNAPSWVCILSTGTFVLEKFIDLK